MEGWKRKQLILEDVTFEQGFESRREEIHGTNEVVQNSMAKARFEVGLESWQDEFGLGVGQEEVQRKLRSWTHI